MEEIKKRFDEYFKGNIDENSYIHINTVYIRNFIQSEIDLAVSKERERVTKEVERAMKYTNWSHSVGSHSDDRGGDSDIECTCMEKEIRYKEEAYKNVLNLINTK